MYALNLNEEKRILSVTYDEYASEDQPKVETLPDGDISEYKYINNEYVYDPLPEPEPIDPEPTAEEDLEAMAIDHEYRIIMIELGLTE